MPRQSVKPEPEKPPVEIGRKRGDAEGILAFREKFEGLKDTQVDTRLGLNARINSGDNSRPAGARDADHERARLERRHQSRRAEPRSRRRAWRRYNRRPGRCARNPRTEHDRRQRLVGSAARRRPRLAHRRGDPDRFCRYKAALYRLYNRELRNDPTLRGQIVLRLTIEPDGSVSMCALQHSDMNAPDLAAQVVERVRTINFGAKEDIQALTIVYPIDFLPAA